jgi:hypothetical protein
VRLGLSQFESTVYFLNFMYIVLSFLSLQNKLHYLSRQHVLYSLHYLVYFCEVGFITFLYNIYCIHCITLSIFVEHTSLPLNTTYIVYTVLSGLSFRSKLHCLSVQHLLSFLRSSKDFLPLMFNIALKH